MSRKKKNERNRCPSRNLEQRVKPFVRCSLNERKIRISIAKRNISRRESLHVGFVRIKFHLSKSLVETCRRSGHFVQQRIGKFQGTRTYRIAVCIAVLFATSKEIVRTM